MSKLLRPETASRRSPVPDYTNVTGLRALMRTPGAKRATPTADYTNVKGVKRLMASPKGRKSPKNDYTDLRGVKSLMRTPKAPAKKSPTADYSNVQGLKNLVATPRTPFNSPVANYTEVSRLRLILNISRYCTVPIRILESVLFAGSGNLSQDLDTTLD